MHPSSSSDYMNTGVGRLGGGMQVGSGYAAAPYPTPEVDRVLALDSITNRVGNTNGTLADLLVAVRSYADSVFGSIPSTSGKGEAGNVKMPSRLDGLSSAVASTDELVSSLREQFERIRSL